VLAQRSQCPLLFQVLDALLDRRSSGCVPQGTLLQSLGCRRDWRRITCLGANCMTGARMDLAEKVLYHQIHPAKLAADITGSIISTYLMWHRRFGLAMLAAWVPAILGSALVLRFADLERLKQSPIGHYIRQFMTRRIEAWRFAGQIVMWV